MRWVFFTFSFAILYSCSKSRTVNFNIQYPIKDLASKPSILNILEYHNVGGEKDSLEKFSTPVIVNREDGVVVAKTAKIKGAKCILNRRVKFTLVTIDYNQNNIFDKNDEAILSAIDDDSVLVNINPFSIKGKKYFFVKFLDNIYSIKINNAIDMVTIEEQGNSHQYDLEFPCVFPNIELTNMETNEIQIISDLAKKKHSLLVIATHQNCNKCYQQFYDYMHSKKNRDNMEIVLFFPIDTDNSIIESYKLSIPKGVDQNVSYLKGSLNKFMELYGLVTFPDAILMNENGLMVKNHYTLNKVK